MTPEQYWVAVAVAIVLTCIAVLITIRWFAEEYLQFFFLMPISGRAHLITKGKEVIDIVTPPDSGVHINKPGDSNFDPNFPEWEVLNNRNLPEEGSSVTVPVRPWHDTRSLIEKWLGVHAFNWLLGYRVLWFKHSWSELIQPEGSNVAYVARSRSEKVGSILLSSFQYYEEAVAVPIKGNISVNIRYTITTRTRNPHTSVVKNDDWLGQIKTIIEAQLRDWTGEQSFDDLRSETDKTGLEAFYKLRVTKLNKEIPGQPTGVGFRKKFGQEVEDVNIISIVLTADPTGENEKILRRKWEAEQNYAAKVEEAKGILATGKAEARVILSKGAATAMAADRLLRAQTSTTDRRRIAERQVLFPGAKTVVIGGDAAKVLLQTED